MNSPISTLPRIFLFVFFIGAGFLKAVEILTPAGEVGPNRAVIGEVLEFGTFRLKSPSKRKVSKTTPDGSTVEAPDAQFTRYTDAIEAQPGTRFGFRFRIRNLPDERETVFRTVVRHPPMRLPSGKTRDHYEMETRLRVFGGSVIETTGYGFDHDFERVPGRWTFEHWYGDKLVVAQSFTVLTPEVAAERQRKMAARFEAQQQLPKIEWEKPLTVGQVAALACNQPRFGVEPGPSYVQITRRSSGFWSGGKYYVFRAEDVPVWKALLSDETASIYGRMIAAGFLLHAGDQDARDFLQSQIESFYRRYNHNAAEVIIQGAWDFPCDPWFEDRLIESIQDERLIGEFSSSSSIPGDFRLFGEGDQLDLMCSTFERVCYALGRAKSRKAVTPLLRWLDSEWGRDSAIEALGDIGDESVAPTLMKRLEAGDTSAARLITALGKLKYRPLISLLIARMDTDLKNDVPKQDGGENSLNALLNLQAKEAIPVVRAWAVHPKIYSQAQARRVLAHLENDDPIPALFLLLKDEKDEYRQCAVIEDLAATRSTRVLQPLLDAAKTSPHTSVRAAAMRGLGTIGSDESLHALTELSHTEFSGWQRVRGVTPQEIIAQVLEAATKQKLRLDFSAWETWLHDHPGFPEMTK